MSPRDLGSKDNPLFHFLHDPEGRRTYCHIFEGKIVDLVEFLAVRMWKFFAGLGTYIVDGTIIIRIQKSTRNLLKHVIMVLVYPKISLYKLLGLEF